MQRRPWNVSNTQFGKVPVRVFIVNSEFLYMPLTQYHHTGKQCSRHKTITANQSQRGYLIFSPIITIKDSRKIFRELAKSEVAASKEQAIGVRQSWCQRQTASPHSNTWWLMW